MKSSAGTVIVGEGAEDVRRRVGLTAWSALEVLVARSRDVGDGVLIAELSVRALASVIGVAKNTAHRAVRRLSAAALVDNNQGRAADGRYITGRYRVTVDPDVLQRIAPSPLNSSSPRSRLLPRRDYGTQLDLLTSSD